MKRANNKSSPRYTASGNCCIKNWSDATSAFYGSNKPKTNKFKSHKKWSSLVMLLRHWLIKHVRRVCFMIIDRQATDPPELQSKARWYHTITRCQQWRVLPKVQSLRRQKTHLCLQAPSALPVLCLQLQQWPKEVSNIYRLCSSFR